MGPVMGHCHLYPGGRGEEHRDALGIPGTPGHLAAFCRKLGFDKAIGLSPFEDPPDPKELARIGPGRDGPDWLLGHPEVGPRLDAAIWPAAALDPSRPESPERLKALLRRGLRFLKVHPIIMRCDVLDRACRSYFEAAEQARLVLILHTGGGSWDWPDKDARPEVAEALAGRYPGLSILMAHAGSFWGMDGFEASVQACQERPNLYLETTSVLLELGAEKWRRALDRLGPARIIYGNDYPFVSADSVRREMELLAGLSPDAAALDLMSGGNLLRLAGYPARA